MLWFKAAGAPPGTDANAVKKGIGSICLCASKNARSSEMSGSITYSLGARRARRFGTRRPYSLYR